MADEPLFTYEEIGGHEIEQLWDGADFDAMGRVLRAGLLVEHYVNEHVEQHHPNAASLARAKLSHYQKTCLLDKSVPFVRILLPGIDALRRLRNKFAHQLNYRVTAQDTSRFFDSGGFFQKFFDTRNQLLKVQDPTPVDTVEYFALFAALWLRGGALIGKRLKEESLRLSAESVRLELESVALNAERELLDDLRSELESAQQESALGE